MSPPRKRSAAALPAPLVDFVSWRLAVDGGGQWCAPGVAYDVKQLATIYRGLTIGAAARRRGGAADEMQ